MRRMTARREWRRSFATVPMWSSWTCACPCWTGSGRSSRSAGSPPRPSWGGSPPSMPTSTCVARCGAGGPGFLVKSTPPQDLIGLVRVASEGHTVLSPAAARRLIAASADSQPAAERARQLTGSLTEREVEVLACLGEGLSNAQIAGRLYLSEATVKGYVSRMLEKLGLDNRTQAGLLAHDAGLTNR